MRYYDGITKSQHKQMARHQCKKAILKAHREVTRVTQWQLKKNRGRKECGLEYGFNEMIQSEAWTEKGAKEEKRWKDPWESIECTKTELVIVPYSKRRRQEYLNKHCSYCPKFTQIVTSPFRKVMGSKWVRQREPEPIPSTVEKQVIISRESSIRATVYFLPKPCDPEGNELMNSKSWNKKTFYHEFCSCIKFQKQDVC